MLAVRLKCLPVVVIDPSKLMFLIKKGGKNNRSDMKGTGKNWLKCFMLTRMKFSWSSSTRGVIIVRVIMRFFSVGTDLTGEEGTLMSWIQRTCLL